MIVFIDPRGEFPINDDWAYAHNARELSEYNHFWFSFWPAMTLVGQTIWSTLITKVFGFSLFALRMSTLLMGIGFSLSSFELFRRISKNDTLSAFAILSLMASPMLLNQSFTYMTELPFLFFTSLSVLGFYLHFIDGNRRAYYWALLALIMVILVRQTALIIPISLFIACIPRFGKDWKFLIRSGLPLILGFATISFYKKWRLSLGMPLFNYSEFGTLLESLEKMEFEPTLKRVGVILHYLGLTGLPFVPILIAKFRLPNWRQALVFLLLGVVTIYALYFGSEIFPHGNIFNNFELGPKLLKNLMYGDTHGKGLSDSF